MNFTLAQSRPAAAEPDQDRPASLQLRVAGLVVGLLLLFAAASVGLQTWTLAQGLQAEQAARNAEAAQVLALTLAAPEAAATLQAQAEARFALGREDRIRVRAAQGQMLVDLDRPDADSGAPEWFDRAWPITAPAGRMSLPAEGKPPAVLEVESARGWAHRLLWQTVSRSAGLLVLFAAAACLFAAAVLRGWLLPWRVTMAELQGLAAERPALQDEAGPPGLRQLARSMAATVRSLRLDVALQAEQVQALQRQTQIDSLTGLALRHHFLGRMQRRLADPPRGGAALLIVRVGDLDGLNLRAGREATDRLLCAVAHVLLTYVDRVAGALAGRLNGSDFALFLPVCGVALETALSLSEALAALPALRNAGAGVAVGGVDDLPQTTSSAALAAADAALARAESVISGGGRGVAVDRHGDMVVDAAGAGAWRQQIAGALTQERGRLEEAAVCNREGRVLHRACTLHLQLADDAPHRPPRHWLALARRAQLLPRVDLLTVQLALHAAAADGLPRCVQVDAASWATPGLLAAVQALLQAAPASAPGLSIELAEPESASQQGALAAAVSCWVAGGARLGIGQGAGLSFGVSAGLSVDLPALRALGICFVTLSAEHLRGLAQDRTLKASARGLVQGLHDLGLSVQLDGPGDPQDLDALWALGLDAVTALPTGAA